MTIAALGLSVDSSSVSRAGPELDRLAVASQRAEAAANSLMSATDREAVAQQRATSAARMHEAALHAEAAAARMAGAQRTNLMFQIQDIGVSLASGMNPLMVAAQQGSQISMIYGPGGMGKALAETGKMAGSLVTRLGPLGVVVGGLTAGFAAMTHEINRTAETQVGLGDVMAATWQIASDSIYGAMKPTLDWLAGVWDSISPGVDHAMNMLIGSFDIAFRNVKTIWSGLPGALGDFTIQTANSVIDGIEKMLNDAISMLNGFIKDANGLLAPLNMSLGKGFDPVDLPPISNPFAGQNDALNAGLAQNAADVRAKTAAGGYTADIGAQAQENARARELEEIGKSAEKAAEGLNVFDEMLSSVDHLLREASDPFTELQSNMDTLGALLASGEISWDQYGKAVAKANLQMASGTLDAIAQITGVLAGAFEDNKMLAAANIVVSTAAGAMKALEQGGAFGFPMAAAITAAGAAQLASVMSAKPGSASIAGVGGKSGATSTAAATQQQAGPPSVVFNLHGKPQDTISMETFKELQETVRASTGMEIRLQYVGG